ncbi:hypothetical protein ACOMHN_029849 [Nucella lapillus]
MSVWMSVDMSVWMSVWMSVNMSVWMAVDMSVWMAQWTWYEVHKELLMSGRCGATYQKRSGSLLLGHFGGVQWCLQYDTTDQVPY